MYYLDFLDALDGPPVHLVGHSLGGWIAAEIAVRNTTAAQEPDPDRAGGRCA